MPREVGIGPPSADLINVIRSIVNQPPGGALAGNLHNDARISREHRVPLSSEIDLLRQQLEIMEYFVPN